MKVVFSRKGFDSAAGGAPSPIIDHQPISLPIPATDRSLTTYRDLGLGEIVEEVTRGRFNGESLCHHDPMFENQMCAFGQVGAAQTHLENNKVGIGDVFLFFGLFSDLDHKDPHHRIFAYLVVDEVTKIGSNGSKSDQPKGFTRRHPHTVGEWGVNNTIYTGRAKVAGSDDPKLRLSIPGANKSIWKVPSWLAGTGLTYHQRVDRWLDETTLKTASRGQEFVTDITDTVVAHEWLETILTRISKGHLAADRDH